MLCLFSIFARHSTLPSDSKDSYMQTAFSNAKTSNGLPALCVDLGPYAYNNMPWFECRARRCGQYLASSATTFRIILRYT